MIKYSLTGFILCLMGMAGFSQLCTTREWHVHQTRSAKIDTTRISGIAENFNFWPTGKVITVGFVNGTTEQRVAVLAIAKEWEKHGNIRFEAADVKDAIVRIRLTYSGANYTYIGTDILKCFIAGKIKQYLKPRIIQIVNYVLGVVLIILGVFIILRVTLSEQRWEKINHTLKTEIKTINKDSSGHQ
ncbi:MAG: hypothetical protein MUE99_09610 [Chitinophagaceae bacterium]|nr:hypothetical protein [Chitinophagaceae bacterium]